MNNTQDLSNLDEPALRRAIVQDLRQSAPWYHLGCLKERQGDPRSAAHCYYLACELGRYKPALERLQSLGYFDIR